MDLLNPLAAGVRGAENGTASIFKRGTSTRATYYLDFEGDSPVATGADITLSANASAIVYVNELCTVEVKDSSGVIVCTFTAGHAAGAVEYQGQSFTGVDYTTGVSAAGNPTTLQAILDAWKTNAHATDWKVLIGSTATTLFAFAGAVGGMFFNVKDPTYGAVGDGVTDDTAAINAALTAANVNGGLVVFPPGGVYRVTSALTLGSKTSLLGFGPNASRISMDHASNNLLVVSGSTSYRHQSVEGLGLDAAQTNSGHAITIGGGSLIRFVNCSIGSSSNTGDTVTAANDNSTEFSFEDCRFFNNSTTSGLFNAAGALKRGNFVRCRLAPTNATCNATNGLVFGRQITMRDCIFDNSSQTAGTYSCFKSNSTTVDAKLTGCDFGSSGGATVTAMELGTYASGAIFSESGSTFGASGVTAYSYVCAAASKGAVVQLGSRVGRRLEVTSDAASFTATQFDQYETVVIKRTANSAQDVAPAAVPPDGATSCLVIWNESGGNFTAGETFSSPISLGPTFFSTITNHSTAEILMRSRILTNYKMAVQANITTSSSLSVMGLGAA